MSRVSKKQNSLFFPLFFGPVLAITLFFSSNLGAEEIYVHAQKIQLKEASSGKSANLLELLRGDKVQKLGQKGFWVEVEAQGKKGFLPKLAVNTHPPIGQAKLMKEIDVSAEKASRKRSSAYAVSATTRGLSAGSRHRAGREKYRANFRALQKIERRKIPEKTLSNFIAEAKLD